VQFCSRHSAIVVDEQAGTVILRDAARQVPIPATPKVQPKTLGWGIL